MRLGIRGLEGLRPRRPRLLCITCHTVEAQSLPSSWPSFNGIVARQLGPLGRGLGKSTNACLVASKRGIWGFQITTLHGQFTVLLRPAIATWTPRATWQRILLLQEPTRQSSLNLEVDIEGIHLINSCHTPLAAATPSMPALLHRRSKTETFSV